MVNSPSSDEVYFDFDAAAKALGVSRDTLPKACPPPDANRSEALLRPLVEPLADDEWASVSAVLPKLPVPKPGVDFNDRTFVDAALWFTAARERGYGWGKLPPDLGPASSREHRWHRWNMLGYWTQIANALRDDERLSVSRRLAFDRLAKDGERRRERILEGRARLNGARATK